jgi:hypothetical protein
MPRLGPISWINFVKRMRVLGFYGPFQEGRHPYMVKGSLSITIPNPHNGQISVDLLVRILHQAGVSRLIWMRFK